MIERYKDRNMDMASMAQSDRKIERYKDRNMDMASMAKSDRKI